MTEQSYTPVRAVMTPSPIVVDGLATVREAIDLMRANKVSSVVIDRRHEHDEYGILVMHDIAAKVIARDQSPDRLNVYEVMSKPVLSVDVGMDVKYAIRLLSGFGLSRGLVTEAGAVVGIVTLRDMVLRFLEVKGDAEAGSG